MKRKYFFGLLLLIIALIALIVTVRLVKERQEIRKKATGPSGVGQITLVPQTTSQAPGGQFSTAINFKTGSSDTDAATISSLSLRITYPYSGSTPELDVVDNHGSPTNQISPNPDLVTTGEWLFPVKSVSRTGNTVIIDLAAINVNPAGYRSTTDTLLATINFKANQETNLTLAFDTTQSKMLTKADPPQDVLASPTNGTYTLALPTATPTSTPTSTPAPMETPAPTEIPATSTPILPTETPTPTATPVPPTNTPVPTATSLPVATSTPIPNTTDTPAPTATTPPNPTTTPVPLVGDLNHDGVVNEIDYAILIAHFGQSGTPGTVTGDVNGDGVVNEIDYALLISHFGK